MEMRWIPVEEAMPKPNEKVLVKVKCDSDDTYFLDYCCWTGDGAKWKTKHGAHDCVFISRSDTYGVKVCYGIRVVAWIEIPKDEESEI